MGYRDGVKLATFAAVGVTTRTSNHRVDPDDVGCMIVVDMTTVGGAPGTGATIRIQGYDKTSNKYFQLNTTPAGITAVGTYVYVVYPGAGIVPGAGSGITQVTDTTGLPSEIRVELNWTDGAFTGTVAYIGLR